MGSSGSFQDSSETKGFKIRRTRRFDVTTLPPLYTTTNLLSGVIEVQYSGCGMKIRLQVANLQTPLGHLTSF